MDVVAAVAGSLTAAAATTAAGFIYFIIRNTSEFRSNLNAVEQEMNNLLNTDDKKELETAEKEGIKLPTQLEEWLSEATIIDLQVKSMRKNMGNCGNLCGCDLNGILHCRWSQKLPNMLGEVQRLKEDTRFTDGMEALRGRVKPFVVIPGTKIGSQTAFKNLAEVMGLLNRDRVRRIGIWGMGGVGKTTLVRILNNELESGSLELSFGIVMWVTVSKELELKKIQTKIAERLKLAVELEEGMESMATKLHQTLTDQKFLLILDDVWEAIDLVSLGVPQPEIETGSKIILTTRFLNVCREMETDEDFKVGVLNGEEAWKLFADKAGEVASAQHIKPVAEAVVRECNGLPLAIITLGKAMRRKEMIEEWQNALLEMQRAEPRVVQGIEREVYGALKLSYDYLQGDIKSCFLYCSLFPEDFSIEVTEIAQCWVAEGLISEQLNYENSLNRGIAIIESLKDSCLLEDGFSKDTVKMHDIVRDVAIWIASSIENGCESLVQSGIGMRQISEAKLLTMKSCKRISIIDMERTTLSDGVIQCPNATTLLLQGNCPLQRVPGRFLQGFKVLRVLNMSRTSIESLPSSLSLLGNLRALVLRECICLEELPSLGGLGKLQVLDLYDSGIRELPKGMEELGNLRKLDLSFTSHLKTMQAGVLSRLHSLEVLHMRQSGYEWGKKGEVEEGRATVEELRGLKQLVVVSLWLSSAHYLNLKDLKWIERLRSFQFLIGDTAHYEPEPTKYADKQVILKTLDLSKSWILGRLIVNASNLFVKSCKEIGWMFEYLATNRGGLAGLKCLTFLECESLGPFRGTCAAQHDLLPNLEELHLWSIEDLNCVGKLVGPLGLTFSKLRSIEVVKCPKLIYLIPHELIRCVINLEEIKVIDCEELEGLFQYSSPDPVVPKLLQLELDGLPKLRSVCGESESWQSLKQLKVINCNLLEKLPLTTQNADTIKEIRGEEEWWSKLKWDADDIKEKLQPFFKPY